MMNLLLNACFILVHGWSWLEIGQTVDFKLEISSLSFNKTTDGSLLAKTLIKTKSLNRISSANIWPSSFHCSAASNAFLIDKIQPILVFYKLGLDEYQVNYTADSYEVAEILSQKGFLISDRLIIITHGFQNGFKTNWIHDFKNSFLNLTSRQTVAILGWDYGSSIPLICYSQAAVNVISVGHWLANYAKAIKQMNSSIAIYGIGHSLGAHVMGVAGRASNSFNRITGLDPAGPCFENVTGSQTIRSTDAEFVDVIHTDGYETKLNPLEWLSPVNHYGILVPVGSIDFYPNYGYEQPGTIIEQLAGSHLRSLELFYWSIVNPKKFITKKILSKPPEYNSPVKKNKLSQYDAEMGYYADQWPLPPENVSTLYYLPTNRESPWA